MVEFYPAVALKLSPSKSTNCGGPLKIFQNYLKIQSGDSSNMPQFEIIAEKVFFWKMS